MGWGRSVNLEYPSSLKFLCRVFKQIELTKSQKTKTRFIGAPPTTSPIKILRIYKSEIQIKTGQNKSIPAKEKNWLAKKITWLFFF